MRPTRLNAAVLLLAAGLLAGTDRVCGQGMDGPDLMASSPAVLPPDMHLQDMVAALPAPAAANPSTGKREVIATSEPVPQLPPPAVERSADASPTLGLSPSGVQPASFAPALPPLPSTPAPLPRPVGVQTPALFLEQQGPSSASAGKSFAYEIIVRNIGTAPAPGVRVQDELALGTRFVSAEPRPETNGMPLTWNLGNLDPGGERRLKVEVVPAGDGEIVSRATATFVTSCTLHAQLPRAQLPRAQLALTATGPAAVQVGEPVPFQIQITNNGTAPATHIVLRDRLPPGLQHPSGVYIEAGLGTLSPGQSRKVTLETKAVQPGRLVNELTATADGGGQAGAQAVVQVSETGLLLRVLGPQETFVNREMEYRLEISNPGMGLTTNVRALEQLPEGLDFIAASNSGVYDPSTRMVQWVLGTLPPRETRAVAVKLMAKVAGNWGSRALAQADRGQEAKAESTVRVDGMPGLTAEVRDLDDPVEVGAETTYEIRVVNQGTASDDNVRVTALVPEAMAVLAAEGPTAQRIQGQQVTFDPLPRLAVGANVVYRVRVRAQKAGDWRFKVSLAADHLQQPVLKEESTRVYSD